MDSGQEARLDILPTGEAWERADARFALAFWPWSLLAQREPLSERLVAAAPDAVVDDALSGWGTPKETFGPEVRAAYIEALRDPCGFHLFVHRLTPPAAGIRHGGHRRVALPPPSLNRWLHTPPLGRVLAQR